MNAVALKVLAALDDAGGGSDFCYCHFSALQTDTRLDRKLVRRTVRALARKGFAEYGRGLWTEDGEPFGSGYCITEAGRAALAAKHSEE